MISNQDYTAWMSYYQLVYLTTVVLYECSTKEQCECLQQVVDARAKATSVQVNINDQKTLDAYQQAQAGLQQSFGRLLATFEQYPDLKTTQAFRDFQVQIEGTENRINVARRDYNDAVRGYNLKVKRFPNNMLAGMFGFKEKGYYEAEKGTEKNPDINFDIK